MITIYGMPSCPGCAHVLEQIQGDDRFNFIDIGSHVKNLKAFIQLRDANPLFDDVKSEGKIGIPCFVLEDGSLTLNPTDLGLHE